MSSKHILGNFEKALEELRTDVLTMASTAEQNLNDAVAGLLNRKPDLCSDAIANDEEVDQLELRIDHEGMRVLSLFQPVARDLRSVVSTMRMATNLERVSDEAGNISRRARKMLKNPELPETQLIEPLHQLASKLLRDSIRSFADGNVDLA
ncbi:MAG: PhoU domain-containing protein, partial [Verrucomicrobiota bacterium]